MKSKGNIVLGIFLILWGIIFFGYNAFFSKILYNNIVSQGTNLILYMAKFKNIVNVISTYFFIALIVLTIISIIYYVKNKDSFSSKDFLISVIATFVFHLLGFRGISWIFAIISGILVIVKKKKIN